MTTIYGLEIRLIFMVENVRRPCRKLQEVGDKKPLR
nr:MAG TPA: hypothetical protein [Caudoviricetes sp.]